MKRGCTAAEVSHHGEMEGTEAGLERENRAVVSDRTLQQTALAGSLGETLGEM